MVGALLDDISSIRIRFPTLSSYSGTYKGQCSDRAFVGGLLGLSIADPDFKNALKIAEQRKVQVSFSIEDLPAPHPNTAYIEISNGSETVEATTFSVGGGAVEVAEVCGTRVSLKGDSHLIVLLSKDIRTAEAACGTALDRMGVDYVKVPAEGGSARFYKVFAPPPQGLLDTLRKELGSAVRYMPPVLPVVDLREMSVPFSNAEGLQAYLKGHPMPFWKAAVEYERARSGWTENAVVAYAEKLLDTMEASIHDGLNIRQKKAAFWKPAAQGLAAAVKAGNAFDLGALNYAHVYATAIMESSNRAGKVCAAPTAGSCGVLGGMLFSIRDTVGCSRENMVEALLCSGLIGVFISQQATFAAEVAACQAENGSASCMAAAAAAYLLGGSVQQMLNGAALAMQNMLGLVCDPIAGCAVIPCINRNSAAIANAVICANLAVGGYDPLIPLDQCIQAMYSVGKLLPRELRCTGLGGLCVTKKGGEIEREFNQNQN